MDFRDVASESSKMLGICNCKLKVKASLLGRDKKASVRKEWGTENCDGHLLLYYNKPGTESLKFLLSLIRQQKHYFHPF